MKPCRWSLISGNRQWDPVGGHWYVGIYTDMWEHTLKCWNIHRYVGTDTGMWEQTRIPCRWSLPLLAYDMPRFSTERSRFPADGQLVEFMRAQGGRPSYIKRQFIALHWRECPHGGCGRIDSTLGHSIILLWNVPGPELKSCGWYDPLPTRCQVVTDMWEHTLRPCGWSLICGNRHCSTTHHDTSLPPTMILLFQTPWHCSIAVSWWVVDHCHGVW